ncbi:2-dehydropantoate 2-reductase N-terminal domain-containing protein [Streptomyces misionensis]|uniref:2-dehydropantoate 2-reductase N-terminal domain-containing protein n=1 Tax=Streptomyces misionensis TaxID=67331 RepID=UPI0033E5AB1B
MSDNRPSIGIVGAGSVGANTAYDLVRAGAHVTFLVRPHRQEQLARPQVMYSYDDNTLDRFDGYDVITDPADLSASSSTSSSSPSTTPPSTPKPASPWSRRSAGPSPERAPV